jgi:hypothetical protein
MDIIAFIFEEGEKEIPPKTGLDHEIFHCIEG